MRKRVVVPYGMQWMKKRLRELDKSGAALARALEIPKERVYEMWKGERRIQQDEIGPMARFLEWSESELIAKIDSRTLNENKKQVERIAPQQGAVAMQADGDINLPPLVLYRTAHTDTGRRGGFMLFADVVDEVPRPFFLRFSKKAFAVKVLDDINSPVYKRWDTVLVDPMGDVVNGEDYLFTSYPESIGGGHSVIACLKSSTDAAWTVHQYGTNEPFDLIRSAYPNACQIVGRYNRR